MPLGRETVFSYNKLAKLGIDRARAAEYRHQMTKRTAEPDFMTAASRWNVSCRSNP
jgi:hypothetical protein